MISRRWKKWSLATTAFLPPRCLVHSAFSVGCSTWLCIFFLFCWAFYSEHENGNYWCNFCHFIANGGHFGSDGWPHWWAISAYRNVFSRCSTELAFQTIAQSSARCCSPVVHGMLPVRSSDLAFCQIMQIGFAWLFDALDGDSSFGELEKWKVLLVILLDAMLLLL